ncbi:Phosphoglycolate phosphatase [bioreactor metagenome]|uniref:Phosphoglycolate phosphatase n=1 Tax=bioreactor metagenome TaxID=1076179 RepID=A0A645JC37_9ZZZZ
MVAEVLARLGAAETNAVFVGDSETDVLTARNAGLPFVGVLWGFRTREELLAAGAEIFIESPDELPAALYALTGGR